MTTKTITATDLAPEAPYNQIVSPVIEDSYRAYGNYAHFDYRFPNNFDITDTAPAYIYLTGSNDIDKYVIDSPLYIDPLDVTYNIAVGHPDLGNFGIVDTDDTLAGDIYSDVIYAGPGNDVITNGGNPTPRLNGKTYFGGSGDDTVYGSAQADSLYGDYADKPDFISNEQWSVPPTAVSTVVDGNDSLYGYGGLDRLFGGGGDDLLSGGDSGDTLYGGDGNDQLDGGPRGSGWTDILYGGDGADLFYLELRDRRERRRTRLPGGRAGRKHGRGRRRGRDLEDRRKDGGGCVGGVLRDRWRAGSFSAGWSTRQARR